MARNARSPLGPLALAFVAILLVTLALWQTVAAGGGGSTGQATTYTVQRGDSLAAIAKKFGVNVEDLAAANDLWPGAFLYRNEVLIIPSTATNGASATQDDTNGDTADSAPEMAGSTSAITETADVDANASLTPTAEDTAAPTEESTTEESTEESAVAQSAPETAEPRAQRETYTVQRGDSLRQIARKLHVSVEELARINGLKVNSILYRRQVLIVPPRGAAAAPQAAATPQATEEATEEAIEEAIEEPTAEPTTEPTAEATEEATEEPTEETAADVTDVTETPTAEATEAPAEETPTPTAEATEEAAEEPTAEATEEATEEPTAEATEEATEEPTEEATEEVTETVEITPTAAITEEVTAEPTATITATEEITATAEPTAEATAEPTEEPTAEATEEATEEPTEEAAAGDLIDTAEAAGNFTILLSALEAAGLTDALRSEGPLTLFAPTDDAFAALPEGRLDELLADPEGVLTQILLYHVVPGTLLADEIGDGQAALTLQGNELTFSVTGDQLQISDASVITSNIETSNGVLHIIDAVLMPPDLAGAPAAPDEATATSPTEGMTQEMTVADAAVIVITAPTQANGVPLVGATDVWQEVSDGIRIITPVSGTIESGTVYSAAYHSPLAVSGLARAAVGSVQISLIGPDDTILAERTLAVGPFGSESLSETTAPDTYAFFAGYMRFYVDQTTEATLRVVEMDMGDGTILSESRVPITLLGGQRVIDITTPVVGQAVCDDIIVSGYSNTFEANVVVRLLTPDGSVQAEIPAMGGTLGVYRDFAATLPYPVDEPAALLVSAAEGDASGRFDSIDQTQIPVTVYPSGAPDCTP